ncbi:MAG: hypothetical protein AB8B55_01725 [Mariniblastus sp.]
MKTKTCLRCLALIFLSSAFALTFPASVSFAQRGRDRGGQDQIWEYYAKKYDKDSDGKLSKSEYDRGDDRFARLDKNKDGVLTKDDWTASGGRRRGGRRGGNGAQTKVPAPGDVAPDFDLVDIAKPDSTIKLSSFAGNKPVALIFGSCT